ADLAGVGDVRAAIGLEVEANDLDGPDLGDARREQVDLGPDQVRYREGLVARQDPDPDVAPGGQLRVDLRLDLADELTGHPLELEVHPPRAGLHVAAGDLGAVVAPDDPAQDVERGVGAHQQVPPQPVDLRGHDLADRGERAGGSRRRRIELMDDVALDL